MPYTTFCRKFIPFIFAISILLAGADAWAQTPQAQDRNTAPEIFVDGEIAVVHIDYLDPGLDRTVHHVVTEIDGRQDAYELRFERGAPSSLRSGQKVNIRGRAVGRQLWVDDITASLDEPTPDSAGDGVEGQVAGATQVRSWIAILVNITGTATWDAGDATAAENVMLHNSHAVDRIYQSGSFGGVGFASSPADGTVVGPISVDKIAGCPYYSYASAANAAVSSAYGINPTGYSHTIYILPQGAVSDCNWLGLGVLGSYGSTTNRYSWVTRNDESLFAHELGHNYGWHHAATDGNNDGYDPSQSSDAEYADTSDTMGYCCTEKTFNAVHLDQAGWLDTLPAGAVVSVLSDGNFTLAPLGSDPATTSDPQVLKIDKPDSNESYYIAYRQATGQDALLSSSYTGGVSLHHGRRPNNWSYLITVLGDGELFDDPVNGLTIQQNWHDDFAANISVSFDACIKRNPTVAVSPAQQVLTSAAQAASYNVTVTNTDSAGCLADSFLLGANQGTLTPSSLLLAPDSPNGSSQLDVAALADGNHAITVTADGSGTSGSGAANLTVDTTAPAAPVGPSAFAKKVRGQSTVTVKWSAPSDILGIAAYRVTRGDGGFTTTTSGTQVSDTSAATTASHAYEIVAIDTADRVGAAANVTYSPDTSGGPGNGNGNGKGRNK